MKKKIKKAVTAKKKAAAKKPAKAKKKITVKKKPAAKKIKRSGVKKAVQGAPKKNLNKPIGVVTHFYNEIGVAIVRFKEKVPLGAVLQFRGATTDFRHPIRSMQYEHEPIRVAPKGKQVGIKVPKRVRVGDKVHRGS